MERRLDVDSIALRHIFHDLVPPLPLLRRKNILGSFLHNCCVNHSRCWLGRLAGIFWSYLEILVLLVFGKNILSSVRKVLVVERILLLILLEQLML